MKIINRSFGRWLFYVFVSFIHSWKYNNLNLSFGWLFIIKFHYILYLQ